MGLLKYFFTNKAYLPDGLPGKLFSPLHIGVAIVLFILVPTLALLSRKLDKKKLKILLIVLWAFLVVYEVVKLIWETSTNPNGFEVTGILPLYLCSIFMYVMPFVLFTKEDGFLYKMGCSYLCTYNLVGGLVNFVYPVNVLTNYPCFTFAGMHTLIYHGSMVYTGLTLMFTGKYKLTNIKEALYGFIPLVIVSIPANIINFIFNASYMFFRGGYVFDIVYNVMPEWCYIIVMYIAYMILPFIFYGPVYLYKKLKK
jgi:hypothetical protein